MVLDNTKLVFPTSRDALWCSLARLGRRSRHLQHSSSQSMAPPPHTDRSSQPLKRRSFRRIHHHRHRSRHFDGQLSAERCRWRQSQAWVGLQWPPIVCDERGGKPIRSERPGDRYAGLARGEITTRCPTPPVGDAEGSARRGEL